MTIRELYDKYNELENKDRDSVWAMLDKNVALRPTQIVEYIASVRELIDTCTKEEEEIIENESVKKTGFKYLNQSILHVAATVAKVFALTDLVGDGDGAGSNSNYYDVISHMGLIDYLWEKNQNAMNDFNEILYAEMEVFKALNDEARYTNYYMKKIYDQLCEKK